MKSINQMVLLTVFMGLVAGLILSPISIHPVLAAAPHPCFGGAADYSCICENNPAKLTATCCWYDTITGSEDCQTCEVNTDTGEFENCHNGASKGGFDSGVVAPPPSGKAPPPSTEKCPDNSAVGQNGNCSPTTQLPDDTSNNNKPNLRGNILKDMMSSQSEDLSGSGEEQENQRNG